MENKNVQRRKEVWVTEKELSVGYELHRLDSAIKKRIEGKLKKVGLDESTVTNGWILKYLYDNKEKEVYQKDIEKHFHIGRSTVTAIIKTMEKKGYISRTSVENDARLKRVILMPKGEEAHQSIDSAIREANLKVIEGITEEEVETLYQIIKKIRENFG